MNDSTKPEAVHQTYTVYCVISVMCPLEQWISTVQSDTLTQYFKKYISDLKERSISTMHCHQVHTETFHQMV